MSYERFNLETRDGTKLNANKWGPLDGLPIKGIVQISHGMAEWAWRYGYFAEKLNKAGYIVYANDHRGHGLTSPDLEGLGYISHNDGFRQMVDDMYDVKKFIEREYPSLPIILFGHSMGSFLAQRFIQLHGEEVDGVILSGSNGKQGAKISVAIMIAYLEMKIKGRMNRSKFLDSLSFGGYNKSFSPNRTKFDWLSRDEEEVDKYIDDSYCGGIFTSSFFYDFLRGLKIVTKEENLELIPEDLPIYIFSGSDDPVGSFGKGVENLANMYRDLGMSNISYKLYDKGRHEMLNEINKDDVIGDIVKWLDESLTL